MENEKKISHTKESTRMPPLLAWLESFVYLKFSPWFPTVSGAAYTSLEPWVIRPSSDPRRQSPRCVGDGRAGPIGRFRRYIAWRLWPSMATRCHCHLENSLPEALQSRWSHLPWPTLRVAPNLAIQLGWDQVVISQMRFCHSPPYFQQHSQCLLHPHPYPSELGKQLAWAHSNDFALCFL